MFNNSGILLLIITGLLFNISFAQNKNSCPWSKQHENLNTTDWLVYSVKIKTAIYMKSVIKAVLI